MLPVPVEWTLKHTGEELQVISKSGETAVTVSTYKRVESSAPIDSARHLKRFLSGKNIEKLSTITEKRDKAFAEYFAMDGSHWYVLFRENKSALLLATGNANSNAMADEFLTAKNIINSIETD